MNATEVTTRVDIDDRIREQPHLLAAVTDGTQYIVDQATRVSPPAIVDWRYADSKGESLRLTLSDAEGVAEQTARENYPTRWILDSVNRSICVLQAWGKLIDRRLDRQAAKVNALLIEYEREERQSRSTSRHNTQMSSAGDFVVA